MALGIFCSTRFPCPDSQPILTTCPPTAPSSLHELTRDLLPSEPIKVDTRRANRIKTADIKTTDIKTAQRTSLDSTPSAPSIMLLPSVFDCDSPQPEFRPRLHAAPFASPPASPPMLSPPSSSLGNIMDACRSLQSLMATPVAPGPSPSLASLPTPPMTHAPMPPKLRLRTHGLTDGTHEGLFPRRLAAPPVLSSKRQYHDGLDHDEQDNDEPAPPSTPKRARIAPEQMPLGLSRSDFHDVHLLTGPEDVDDDGPDWTDADDRLLVELVLDKLRLSKTDWQDCARSLGKDRHSLGRRWKSLMAKGDVGLKTRGPSRRARLHHTWR